MDQVLKSVTNLSLDDSCNGLLGDISMNDSHLKQSSYQCLSNTPQNTSSTSAGEESVANNTFGNVERVLKNVDLISATSSMWANSSVNNAENKSEKINKIMKKEMNKTKERIEEDGEKDDVGVFIENEKSDLLVTIEEEDEDDEDLEIEDLDDCITTNIPNNLRAITSTPTKLILQPSGISPSHACCISNIFPVPIAQKSFSESTELLRKTENCLTQRTDFKNILITTSSQPELSCQFTNNSSSETLLPSCDPDLVLSTNSSSLQVEVSNSVKPIVKSLPEHTSKSNSKQSLFNKVEQNKFTKSVLKQTKTKQPIVKKPLSQHISTQKHKNTISTIKKTSSISKPLNSKTPNTNSLKPKTFDKQRVNTQPIKSSIITQSNTNKTTATNKPTTKKPGVTNPSTTTRTTVTNLKMINKISIINQPTAKKSEVINQATTIKSTNQSTTSKLQRSSSVNVRTLRPTILKKIAKDDIYQSQTNSKLGRITEKPVKSCGNLADAYEELDKGRKKKKSSNKTTASSSSHAISQESNLGRREAVMSASSLGCGYVKVMKRSHSEVKSSTTGSVKNKIISKASSLRAKVDNIVHKKDQTK